MNDHSNFKYIFRKHVWPIEFVVRFQLGGHDSILKNMPVNTKIHGKHQIDTGVKCSHEDETDDDDDGKK